MRYSSLLEHPHSWEENLRYLTKDCNPAVLVKLLKKRPEYCNPDQTDPTDRAMFKSVMNHFERNLQDKTVALVDR